MVLRRERTMRGTVAKIALGVFLAVLVCGFFPLPSTSFVIADPFASPPTIADADAREIVGGLLTNTYRAFDHHDESLIYDRLSQSIDGDLLSQVYLETRQSIEVKNQGGLRISVKDVTIGELAPLDQTAESTHSFRVRWRVAGSIGHWGHIHRRANEHVAELTIAPRDDRWKIIALEMLDEQRVETPLAAAVTN
jgi:hypothetical protein